MARIMLLGGDGGRSGVPRHISHLAEALSAAHDVIIVSDSNNGGFDFAAARGLRHVEVAGLQSSLDPRRFLKAARALRGLIDEIQPDLVWAHARMTLPLARWVVRGSGPRLAATYHGLPFGRGMGFLRSVLGWLVDLPGLVLGPRSDLVFLTEEDLSAFPGFLLRRHRISVIPNCSDLGGRPAPLPDGPARLLMLTRVSRQKNLGFAAEIFALLPADYALQICGIGTQDPSLRSLFSARMPQSALDRIEFLGERSDVADLLAKAHGLLVTSRYEGLSIAMIEAMEAGRLVISTPVGGTGLLARVHPGFVGLEEDPGPSAERIVRSVVAFRAGTPAPEAIHAAWAAHFASEGWAARVRSFVDAALPNHR